MTQRWLTAAAFFLLSLNSARADKLVRIAGGGTEENNVPATKAKLIQPFGIDFDKAGNFYLVELKGDRVLKVDTKGILTIVAGPGVMADITRILANHHISISSVIQHEALEDTEVSIVPLIIMTHTVPTGNFQAALNEIDRLVSLRPPSVYYPVGD